MSVVEPNYWDGIFDGVNPGDEEFADILDILDFPMESLEGDGLGGEWDASKFQSLGPIPIDALTGLPPVSQGNIGNGSGNRVLSYNTPIDRKSAQKELPNYVEEKSGTCIPSQDLMSSESGAFQTPSPVSVLESSGSCSSGKSLSIRSEIVIPVRARSKRARPSTVNPWLLILPITSAASVSKKTSNTGKNKEKKIKLSQLSNPLEAAENSFQQAKKKPPQQLDAMEKKETSLQRSVAPKKCTHCEVTKTPQWREGPLGPKTLCNACGVRYRSGRLFPEYRPAASPSFIPYVHSNSHKKVIEMRKKVMQHAPVAEELPMSPLPEFVPMSSYLPDCMY